MPYIGNPIYQSAFVTDQFSGNGSTTAFTMSVAPAGVSNVLVAVSGVLQDPSTYGVVGNTITFSTAPPSGTGNISCRYLGVPATGVVTTAYRTVTEFTATAGQTTFTPPSYTVGYINVYRNGVRLGSADYTASNGTTVVLATGATAGDLVATESFLVSSVLNALPQSGGTLSGNLVVTGTEIINGSLGIGTASPAAQVEASASGATEIRVTTVSSGNPRLGFNATGAVYTYLEANRATGNLDLVGGNLKIAFSNYGIVFNNSSALANSALNDYETGTWTPTLLFGGASTGITYVTQQASYVKVGKMVFVQFRVYLSNKGSATGAANVGGLPFPATGSNNLGYPAGTFTFEGNGVALPNGLFGIAWSDSTIYLRANNGGTAFTNLTNSNFNNASEIWGSITYQAQF